MYKPKTAKGQQQIEGDVYRKESSPKEALKQTRKQERRRGETVAVAYAPFELLPLTLAQLDREASDNPLSLNTSSSSSLPNPTDET